MDPGEIGRRCAAAAASLGAVSLAVTLGLRWSGAGAAGAWRTMALVETGALLVLVGLTARLAPRSAAAVATAVGGAALTGLWLVRFDAPGLSPLTLVGLVVWTGVAGLATVAGGYLRRLDGRHERELAAARAGRAAPALAGRPAAPLTERERRVAALVADGRTNGEIAAELYLAPGTVKNHVANIQRKLGTRNRVGIAAWVLTSSDSP